MYETQKQITRMEQRKQWQKVVFRSKPTIFVDQNGVIYYKNELKNLSYHVKRNKDYNESRSEKEYIRQKVVEIFIDGEQLELFKEDV